MSDRVLGISSQYDRACQYRLAYGLARPVAPTQAERLYSNYQVHTLKYVLLLKPSDAMVAYFVLGG